MGGPGSGKGTAVKRLCEATGLKCIETGAIFRALPAESEIARLIAAGAFVPDSELFKLMESNLNISQDIFLDGFPRTLPQAEWLAEKYASNSSIRVFYLNVPDAVMKQRIENRLRENSGAGRADDRDDSVIARRIDIFQRLTMPAIDWMRANPSLKFFDIDAVPPIEDVMRQIMSVLEIRLKSKE
jgi:adenylate kinase